MAYQNIPDPQDFPELREGTKEYEERQHRIKLWESFDKLAYEFMILNDLPNQFRVDCFDLIKKYDLHPEHSKE